MISIQLPREPGSFRTTVYDPGLYGLSQLGQNPDNPPRNEQLWKTSHTSITGETRRSLDYWTRARDSLCAGYNRRCVYSCFIIEPVRDVNGKIINTEHSIDHFTPKSLAPSRRAFEWNNLRWCWEIINNEKDDNVIAIDPVSLPGNLFELELETNGNWMVVPSQGLNSNLKIQVQDTIDKLGLNSIRAVVIRRNQYANDFIRNPNGYTDHEMDAIQPFIFRELRRQGLA